MHNTNWLQELHIEFAEKIKLDCQSKITEVTRELEQLRDEAITEMAALANEQFPPTLSKLHNDLLTLSGTAPWMDAPCAPSTITAGIDELGTHKKRLEECKLE